MFYVFGFFYHNLGLKVSFESEKIEKKGIFHVNVQFTENSLVLSSTCPRFPNEPQKHKTL